jgi:integral membrane protein
LLLDTQLKEPVMPDKSLFSRFFGYVSLAEGVSFLLLLCVGMPIQFAAGNLVLMRIFGTVHGLLFIAYVLLALDGRRQLRWTGKRTAWVLVMAVLPTGAFFAERSVRAELASAAHTAQPVAA